MIIFLYGEDTYRLKKKAEEIEKGYKEANSNNLAAKKLSAEEINFSEFFDIFFQMSIFAEKKLFFLNNLFANKKFKDEFLTNIKNVADSKDIVVIIELKKPLAKDKLALSLKRYGKSQEFCLLTPKKLKMWAAREFQNSKAEISDQALAKLIGFVGNDTWRLSNEIKKLILYKENFLPVASAANVEILHKVITNKDIEAIVEPRAETAIFQTIGSLAKKNKKEALKLIQKHLDNGDNPLYLLKMIIFQFRNLLLVKSQSQFSGRGLNKLGGKFNIHPYVFKKTLAMARGFSLDELKLAYEKIFKSDIAIKTGQTDAETGLRQLIMKI